MSVASLSQIDESLARYFSAVETFNDLVNRKQPVGSQTTKEVACCAMMVFYAYNLPCNRTSDGQPRTPIPPQLANDVARNIQSVLEGHIPQWMLQLIKRGAPSADPRMRED